MNNLIHIKILNDISEISVYTSEQLISAGQAGKAALSFGSTYRDIFKNWSSIFSKCRLAGEEKKASFGQLPSFYPVDERMVLFENEDSNWGEFWRNFLSVYGADYEIDRHPESVLSFREMIESDINSVKPFDLIFLGLGQDGHSASLFPETCPDRLSAEWFSTVLETRSCNHSYQRLTLGPEVIACSVNLSLVVSGTGKRTVLRRLIHQLESGCRSAGEFPLFPAVKIIRRRIELGLASCILCDKTAADGIV